MSKEIQPDGFDPAELLRDHYEEVNMNPKFRSTLLTNTSEQIAMRLPNPVPMRWAIGLAVVAIAALLIIPSTRQLTSSPKTKCGADTKCLAYPDHAILPAPCSPMTACSAVSAWPARIHRAPCGDESACKTAVSTRWSAAPRYPVQAMSKNISQSVQRANGWKWDSQSRRMVKIKGDSQAR